MSSVKSRKSSSEDEDRYRDNHAEHENTTSNASMSEEDHGDYCDSPPKDTERSPKAVHCNLYLEAEGCLCRLFGFLFLALVVFFGGVCAGYFTHSNGDMVFALMAIGITMIYGSICFIIFWVVQRKKRNKARRYTKDRNGDRGTDDIETGNGNGRRQASDPHHEPIKVALSTFLIGILASVIFLMGFFVILKGAANGYDDCYVRSDAYNPSTVCMENVNVGIVLVLMSHIFFCGAMCITRSFWCGKR